MAIVNPEILIAEAGQDYQAEISMTPAQSVVGWTVSAILRAYNGGPALATKTIGSGITVVTGTGVFTVTFTAAELTLTPGSYTWEFLRTNSGFAFPIVEPSAFFIRSSSAAATPTLTNLSEVAAYLQLGTITDAEVPFLLMLIAAAEAAVMRICQRKFYRQVVTEYLSGNTTQTILLTETPVVSITNLYLDPNGLYGQGVDPFPASTLQVSGVDYFLKIDSPDGMSYSGCVNRIRRAWPIQWEGVPRWNLTPVPVGVPGCVKVTYVSGTNLIPADLKQALFAIIADRRNTAQYGNAIVSESFESYSMSLGSAMDEAMKVGSVARTLNSYRRFTLGL